MDKATQDVVKQELRGQSIIVFSTLNSDQHSIKALSDFAQQTDLTSYTVLSTESSSSVALEAHYTNPSSITEIRTKANLAQIDVNIVSGHIRRKKRLLLADMDATIIRDESLDESQYSEFIKDYENTYFKEVYDTLSSRYKLGRVRILLKEPRSTLSWHRDPEPRLHIPIITNPGCLMVIDNVAKHMPADGSVWVTNNTKYHNAFNGGEENRIHLVACVLDYKFN